MKNLQLKSEFHLYSNVQHITLEYAYSSLFPFPLSPFLSPFLSPLPFLSFLSFLPSFLFFLSSFFCFLSPFFFFFSSFFFFSLISSRSNPPKELLSPSPSH